MEPIKSEKVPRLRVYPNPFWNELLIFDITVPSSQDKYKPIPKEDGKTLYEWYEKQNVTSFRNEIQMCLRSKLKPHWPYTNDLYVAVGITGTMGEVYIKDIDNLLKSLLDALKGIVFADDKQIIKISAEKDITDEYRGVSVAIRELTPGSKMRIAPYFWATDNDPWLNERLEEMQKGRFSIIDSYL